MKIHVFHLGFDSAQRVRRTITRFWENTDTEGLDINQVIVSAAWPLPSKSWHSQILWEYSGEFECGYLYLGKNYGQDGNYEHIRKAVHNGIDDNDIVVFYDTDNRFDKRTWLKDSLKVFQAEPRTGFMCTNCSCTDNTLSKQGAHHVINDVKVREICWPGGWSTGIHRGSFFKKGWLQTRDYYGGSEWNILTSLRSNKMIGYMLEDHDDLRDVEGWDPDYVTWKAEMIHKTNQKDFEQWLISNGKFQSPQ